MMLLATLENMEKCKDISGVVALDTANGETFSATAGDYFWVTEPDMPMVNSDNEARILAVKVCKWVDPITGEDIIAQIPAEEN